MKRTHGGTLWKLLVGSTVVLISLIPANMGYSQGSVDGGTIRVGIGSLVSLDPGQTSAVLEGSIERQVLETLTGLDRDGNPHPLLAEKWTSADSKTWTITLRRGVQFSDGTPLTADAVKANFDRLLDPKAVVPERGNLGTLKSVDVVDPLTLRFHCDPACAVLPQALSHYAGGIISPESLKQWGNQVGLHLPVGTGPFVFGDFVPRQRVILRKNTRYWGEKAHLDQIEIQVVVDDAARAAMLRSGQIDVDFYVPVELMDGILRTSGMTVVAIPSIRLFTLHINTQREDLKDVRVRRALSMAIDNNAIANTVFRGTAVVGESPVPPGHLGFTKLTTYPYDPQRALQLLSEAGWQKGSDNFLQKDGHRFHVSLYASRGRYPKDAEVAEVLAGFLRTIGVEVELHVDEFGTFDSHALSSSGRANDDLVLYAWGFPQQSGALMLAQVYRSGAFLNVSNYANPEVDRLTTLALGTADISQQKALVVQASKIILSEAPTVVLVSPRYLVGIVKRLHGVYFAPNEYHSFAGAWLDSR